MVCSGMALAGGMQGHSGVLEVSYTLISSCLHKCILKIAYLFV